MADRLTPDDDLKHSIDRFVDGSRFASREDVVRAAMEMMHDLSVDDLDAALDKSLADVKAGRITPAEEVFAELRDRCQNKC